MGAAGAGGWAEVEGMGPLAGVSPVGAAAAVRALRALDRLLLLPSRSRRERLLPRLPLPSFRERILMMKFRLANWSVKSRAV